MIPYGKQDITQNDIDAVLKVLKSDFLTQGPVVPDFENKIANHVGADHSIAFNSATSALHAACLALDLGPGDWLWTSPISFVASANCGLYCGAKIDFIDINPQTFNICPLELEKKLIIAKKLNNLPKVLVLVHMCGHPSDLEEISALAKKYNVRLIEDASHAVGAKYKNQSIGSCFYSDITIFSFHPVKIITTGEGGMALTNIPELAEKMMLLRTHGITRDINKMSQNDGPWYYQQISLGFNYRMTDIQAALGITQCERLDSYVTKRNEIANFYNKALSSLPVKTPVIQEHSYSSYHLYIIRLNLKAIRSSHHDVFVNLRELGIGVNLHYIPIHLHPYYQNLGFQKGDFPNAEIFYSEAISLPMFPIISDDSIQEVVNKLELSLN
ncbi:UDP-4-amino-4,6-dideoxy-N-acetyl-beta-L-altrosamine transaminase [Gammaproteobacteria bacterium]|nr:UDP-4-amino-4,6-dideoxy-N-acetyl-beta-L-altrosamine transaminase [Gammaproteobacteria bacterium]MDA8798640.1 UDP-4-amino-4,6-dideoxy-N-acetyl-beta-L-altrosamine transaminase [Gammaproteobacteria bacterium]MDC0919294.1 UDP-4-amino-4,6-dideoxy-N-acetyl-beta-L-altrosamine transaminase [Gammaproteobacteria bacterium]